MRYLTLSEVNERHGGILPPDACLRADDEPDPSTTPRPATTTRTPPRGRERAGKTNPVVRKVRGYVRFFEVLPTLKTPPSPGAIALWCWLWTCERKGKAHTSYRRLAERFGAGQGTIRRRLAELEGLRLIRRVRRGRHGRTSSVYRVRPTPLPE